MCVWRGRKKYLWKENEIAEMEHGIFHDNFQWKERIFRESFSTRYDSLAFVFRMVSLSFFSVVVIGFGFTSLWYYDLCVRAFVLMHSPILWICIFLRWSTFSCWCYCYGEYFCGGCSRENCEGEIVLSVCMYDFKLFRLRVFFFFLSLSLSTFSHLTIWWKVLFLFLWKCMCLFCLQ